ncbi:MAG: 50S ribosomal protein L10 [Thermoanaerobaculia bacterium]
MALTREQKESMIGEYEGALAKAPHAIVMGFQGIKVPQVTALRQKVRESGGTYVVVKNTLALRAIDGSALASLKKEFTGPTAVAFTDGDVVALAKVLTQYAKEIPALQFKGGIVDGQPIAGDQVKEIASLPSREELLAKLLFLLQSPVTRFVRTLAAVTRDFVVVLDQIAKQKDGATS